MLLLLAVLIVTSIEHTSFVKADPIFVVSTVQIEPFNFKNGTDFEISSKENFTLTFDINAPNYLKEIYSYGGIKYEGFAKSNIGRVECSVNGTLINRIDNYAGSPNYYGPVLPHLYSVNLTGLQEGTYFIEVAAEVYYTNDANLFLNRQTEYSGKIYFTIEHTLEVGILSLTNQTYTNGTVPLNFIVNKPFSMAAYNLNGENVTVKGNTTLTDLPNDVYNLTVYVWDEENKFEASETITFIVEAQENKTQESLQTDNFLTELTGVGVGLAALVISVVLLMYNKLKARKKVESEGIEKET
jgi:hypothetical protein